MRAALLGCVGFGLGLGIFSCTFFLSAWLVAAPMQPLAWVQFILAVIFTVLVARSELTALPQIRFNKTDAVLRLAVPVFAYAMYGLALICIYQPHGEWDAWAIWNMHARYLFRGGEQWTLVFADALAFSHNDYPLLLSAAVAGSWTLLGRESTIIASAISFLFTIATICLMVASVCILRRDWSGIVAGLVLIISTGFLWHGSYQMADIPLAFYMLLAVVLLQLSEVLGSTRLQFLAGMAAALAAWTKNEGLLFVVVMVAAQLAGIVFSRKTRRENARYLIAFGAGLLPVMAVVIAFKLHLAPPSDLLYQAERIPDRFTDLTRYAHILRAYEWEIGNFGRTALNPLYALLGLAAYAAFGLRGAHLSRAQFCSMSGLALMFAGYFFVYVITPLDLQWHLSTSLERLFLHFWPPLVFIVACIGLPLGEKLPEQRKPARSTIAAGLLIPLLLVSVVLTSKPSDSVLSSETKPQVFAAEDTTALITGRAETRVPGFAVLSHRSPLKSLSETMLAPVNPIRAGLFPFEMTDGFRTSVTISNITDTAAAITLEIAGSAVRKIDIAAGKQVTAFLNEAPFNVNAASGAIVIRSSTDVIVAAFLTYETRDGAFRMAVIPVNNLDSRIDRLISVPVALYGLGWSTELVLVNPTDTGMSGRHRWLDSNGRILEEHAYNIPAQSQLKHRKDGAAHNLEMAHIEVVPEGAAAPVASARMLSKDDRGLNIMAAPVTPAGVDSRTFLEWSRDYETDLVVVNPGSQTASITLTMANATSDHQIAPGGTLIQPMKNIAGFKRREDTPSIIEMKADQPVVMAAIRWALEGSRRTPRAVYTAEKQGSFFPYFAVGSPFGTTFVLFPEEGGATPELLKFADPSGRPIELNLTKR